MSNADTSFERVSDVVVVGSGGSGLIAALTASDQGSDVLVLEKAPVIGGTTAVSGGGLWLPNSRPVVEEAGSRPTEELMKYLRRITGERVPDELLETFVETAPEVVDYVEAQTALEFQFAGYPDYHSEMEGGSTDGNMIEPVPFDGTRLGENVDAVREDPHTPFPTTVGEVYNNGGHARFVDNTDFDELVERMERGLISGGRALIAGLYEACLDEGVEFERSAPASELVTDGGRVVGVVADIDDETVRIGADSVVVAAGGIEWDEEMCDNFLRGPMTAPATPPYQEGDGVEMGLDVGAKLGNMNEAWWYPTARVPGEEWEDGSPLYRLFWARTLPGAIMVNDDGERFCNETGNYHDLGKRFHAFDPKSYDYENVPAYAIVDSDFRNEYKILTVSPDQDDPSWLTRGETLAELASTLGIDADGLEATVERFNEHARDHEDPDFGRGESYYDHFVGDPEADHPNLAPLDEPPYYAVEVHPGCIGTKGGLVTTEGGEVLDVDEEPIPGLFAASNSTRHVMGMGYAGAGGTLGPNAVFGYLAGRSAAGAANERSTPTSTQ